MFRGTVSTPISTSIWSGPQAAYVSGTVLLRCTEPWTTLILKVNTHFVPSLSLKWLQGLCLSHTQFSSFSTMATAGHSRPGNDGCKLAPRPEQITGLASTMCPLHPVLVLKPGPLADSSRVEVLRTTLQTLADRILCKIMWFSFPLLTPLPVSICLQ